MRNHTAAHLVTAAVKEIFPVSHFKEGCVDEENITSYFAVYGYSYREEGKHFHTCFDTIRNNTNSLMLKFLIYTEC